MAKRFIDEFEKFTKDERVAEVQRTDALLLIGVDNLVGAYRTPVGLLIRTNDKIVLWDGVNFNDLTPLKLIKQGVMELGGITYYDKVYREPCNDCPYCGCECDTGCAAAPFASYFASDFTRMMDLIDEILWKGGEE